MKNKIEVETYRFVGDSKVNKVKKMETINGERQVTGNYTQTSFIKSLNECKKYMLSGRKISTGKDDRAIFQVDLSEDKENVSQIIQIVMDQANLDKADPNALAIENLCNYSIKVKHNRIRNAIAATLVGTAVGYVMLLGFVEADKKESQYLRSNDLTNPDPIVDYEDFEPYKEIDEKYDYSDSDIAKEIINSNYSDDEAKDISNDEYSSGKSY